VQREHLHELEELAADIAGIPPDSVAPDAFARQTEESDEQVRNGKMQNESVDGADPVLAMPVDANDSGDVGQQRGGRKHGQHSRLDAGRVSQLRCVRQAF